VAVAPPISAWRRDNRLRHRRPSICVITLWGAVPDHPRWSAEQTV